MAPRRPPQSFNSLSPHDATHPPSAPASPAHIAFPQARSSSPSGISHFLSKPSKWFGRKTSDPRSISIGTEPRISASSVRRPKISRPTDPRPILSSFQSEPHAMDTAKSTAELTYRPKKSLELNSAYPSSSQQSSPDIDGGLGDLRNISRKTWSKSADDLRSFPDPSFSRTDISFQHRIQEYRNRSNSSATLHPASSANNAIPSGSMVPSSSSPVANVSSSPPDDTFIPNEPNISISVSSPTSDGFVLPDDSPPTPTARTHTFAHRLPTKLSASKLGIPPNSPKRKGSGDSIKHIDSDKSSGTSTGRGVFPFNLAGPPHKHSVPNLAAQACANQPSSSLLAPPTSSDVLAADEGIVSRRTSQITYHSGFINRLTDPAPMIQAYQGPYSTVSNYPLAKGWKPFKAELKGSKLYFYKPPSDRSTAIKDLFPTGVVPPTLEDEAVMEPEVSEDIGRLGRVREDPFGSVGRKKRAYWGRRTHPELVVSEGHIVKGTFEALVHEAVFATTFVVALDENAEFVDHTVDGRTPDWKDFSSAIILCLPPLVDRTKFENEFTRLSSNLVDGADEENKETERARVVWMAQEYIRYYGIPSDESGWQEFTSGTIPGCNISPISINGGVPKSVSTQAIYTPSPNPNSGSPQIDGTNTISPNLGTFSPRPQDGKMASLMEALGTSGIPPTTSGKLVHPRQQRSQLPFTDAPERPTRIWAMLVQDGFSREVLAALDPHVIAFSLQTFHRRTFQYLPDNLTVDHVFGLDAVPGASDDEAHAEPSHSANFFGTDDHPHWLTKLLLIQILGSDSSNANNSHLDRMSRTHSRSEVLSIWARVGELCRTAGDECSWKAISAALCSRPVSRLTKVWRRADRQSVIAVESWIYPENDGHIATAREPMMTAWGGDTKEQIRYEMDRARNEADEYWATEPFLKVKNIFESLRTRFALCSRTPVETASQSQDIAKLVSLWEDLSEGKGVQNAFSLKFQRVDQFMSLSLAAEPRRKGLFEPFFWSQSTASPYTHCHPLVPLLFVEPLPTVSLIDRGQVWRGRLESGPTKLSVEELQQLRNIDTSLRPFGKDPSSSKDKLLRIGDVDLGGTAIPVYDGELLLVARSDKDPGSVSRPASRAPSRPPSSAIETASGDRTMVRTPSIRVKPGSSQGIERKSSVQRRSSLPAISQRTSHPVVTEVSTERPIRVLVQAGTLDRLVNVLIHGLKGVSVAVADDNGETSLRDGNTRDLVVDHVEFARVWWNVFRSFVTPIVFFELLRKRFVGSRPSSNTSANAPIHVVQYRSEIFGAVKEWITTGGGAQDCLDDLQLYEMVRAFLDAPLDRSVPDCLPVEDDDELARAWDELEVTRKDTLSTFISHSLRPPVLAVAVLRPTGTASQHRSFGNQAPDLDRITAEDLVDNLDAMGYAAFSNVSEEDLFITADLLEVQSADRTGWFSARETSFLDDADIQTMYSHLMDVEPTSMMSDSQDSVYRLLPPSVRSCIRAYNILRKWFISKLVTPKLGVRNRQARMELCLRAIEIARVRSLEGGCAAPAEPHERPIVRSFVEAVLTAVILSPESRMHHRPWQNVATGRGVQCDSLSALLSRPMVPNKSYGDPLIVDISWLLERMLEIVSIPNTVTISSEDPQSIINLDKRRHLCNVILNTPTLFSKRGRSREDVDRRDFERLNNIEKEVGTLHFDLRGIKEEALREAFQAQTSGSASAKKAVRPFQRLVSLQHEKNKRDKYLYDRLSKDKKQEQLRIERRDEYLNKVMRPRKPMTQAQKQHRMKKSYSSAFFQLMRPISSAFTDHTLASKKSPAELDFVPSGKPSLVLSIVGAKVAHFVNNERSYMFQLDTEEGEQYLLQAFSRQEMARWIETITNVSKIAAKRRLTYLGNSPKPQLSDHIIDPVGGPSISRDPTAVFGVELEFLLEREAGGEEIPPGTVPSVIANCLSELESRGLSEVGIYRIAGATLEINALRDAFNRGEMPITEETDVYAICDLVKSWFRLLPEPVFASSAYYAIIEAIKVENLHARLSSIRSVVHGLPRANFELLKRVAEHLDKVTDFEEQNHMTAEALAIVFSPNLLRAPQNDFALILANMGSTHKLVKALITHFHVIFDEDYEAENDVEEEDMEAPILEEDEEEEEEEGIAPSQSTHTGYDE